MGGQTDSDIHWLGRLRTVIHDMNRIRLVCSLVLSMLVSSPTNAGLKAEPPKTIFGQTVVLQPGVETWIEFDLTGDRLTNPKYASCAPGEKRSIRLRLQRHGGTVLFSANHRFSRVVHFRAVLHAKQLGSDPWRFAVTIQPNREYVEAWTFSGDDSLILSDFILGDE